VITQYFGGSHKGIDIATRAGTPIAAAAGGTVVLAAYGYYGYGNTVIIRHPNGIETLYAHLTEIWVRMGQTVGQGDSIGTVGCTGYCTGPHLHFEVRVGGSPVNPLNYLP
jgi:murein DD-endopeptidase MepM/ murein hydrolase activator NlpD